MRVGAAYTQTGVLAKGRAKGSAGEIEELGRKLGLAGASSVLELAEYPDSECRRCLDHRRTEVCVWRRPRMRIQKSMLTATALLADTAGARRVAAAFVARLGPTGKGSEDGPSS